MALLRVWRAVAAPCSTGARYPRAYHLARTRGLLVFICTAGVLGGRRNDDAARAPYNIVVRGLPCCTLDTQRALHMRPLNTFTRSFGSLKNTGVLIWASKSQLLHSCEPFLRFPSTLPWFLACRLHQLLCMESNSSDPGSPNCSVQFLCNVCMQQYIYVIVTYGTD